MFRKISILKAPNEHSDMNSPKMDCKQSNLEFMHNADLPQNGIRRKYLIGAYKGFTLLNRMLPEWLPLFCIWSARSKNVHQNPHNRQWKVERTYLEWGLAIAWFPPLLKVQLDLQQLQKYCRSWRGKVGFWFLAAKSYIILWSF